MDWDSPSHETGTVRRRPVSFETTTSVPVSTDCHLENVEYYEVKDCVGGYGLTLLKSIDRFENNRNTVPGFLAASESGLKNGIEAVNDNGNDLKQHPPSSTTTCKEDIWCKGKKEEGRTCDSKDRAFSDSNFFSNCTNREEEKENEIKKRNREGEERGVGGEKSDFNSGEESRKEGWKLNNARKDFGLRLCERSYEWRSKASRVSMRKCDARRRSLIPRPKTRKYVGRGVVNSSSESSGIGSPLSPLSPSNDGSAIVKAGSIKSSGSKSSGFGSPEDRSPLSPESQGYAAFYLIEQQLEKLRNCGCERRQAQVK